MFRVRDKTVHVFSHGNRCLYITITFVLWTITSFFSHQSAKYFLTLTGSDLTGVVLLSFLQLSLCFLLTTSGIYQGANAKTFRYLAGIGHVVATISTNYSLSLIHASSTFAIKMLDPITCALVQWIVFHVSIPTHAVVSLPVIITGAVIFTGNPRTNSTLTRGFIWAVMSTLALAFRNIAMKTSLSHGKALTTRSYKLTLVLVSMFILLMPFLAMFKSSSVAFTYSVALTSAVSHVLYNYLSVAMVLKSVSVVTHAVMNIFKRVFVVVLMCILGQREMTLLNISGLALSTVGLLLYVLLSRRQKDDVAGNITLGRTAFSCRILFFKLFCMVSVCLVVVTVATGSHLHFVRALRLTFTSKLQAYPDHPLVNDTLRFDGNVVDVREFLKWHLVKHPKHTNILSRVLKSRHDLIEETRRIHANIFEDLFGRFKYAMLFDLADYENKGDPAIAVGEIRLLRKMGIKLMYYCTTARCSRRSVSKALTLSRNYNTDDLVILLQGGGNLFSYPGPEAIRILVLETFPHHTVIIFPQSVWPRSSRIVQRQVGLYNNHSKLTIAVRDRKSMGRLENLLKNPKLILVPDMAFEIGEVPRFHPPGHDILWLKRMDLESLRYIVPHIPTNITCHVGDWLSWSTPKSKGMEYAFNMATNGFMFLQQGRVVITDRLHGHILSTLLGIPHVLLDNNIQKLSAYRDTWTRGLEFVKMAKNGHEALMMAIELLNKYNNTLPEVLRYDSPYN